MDTWLHLLFRCLNPHLNNLRRNCHNETYMSLSSSCHLLLHRCPRRQPQTIITSKYGVILASTIHMLYPSMPLPHQTPLQCILCARHPQNLHSMLNSIVVMTTSVKKPLTINFPTLPTWLGCPKQIIIIASL